MNLENLAPVDDDATYVRHVSMVILGWLLVTFLVALLMAGVIVFAT